MRVLSAIALLVLCASPIYGLTFDAKIKNMLQPAAVRQETDHQVNHIQLGGSGGADPDAVSPGPAPSNGQVSYTCWCDQAHTVECGHDATFSKAYEDCEYYSEYYAGAGTCNAPFYCKENS